MKDLDFKDNSSPRLFGKGIVIVIVVIFSSLSFVLGYFVGKVGRDERAEPFVKAADAPVQPKDPDLLPAKPETAAQNGLPSSDTQAHHVTVVEQPKKAPAPDSNLPALPKEPEKSVSKQSSPAIVKGHAAAQKKEASRGDKSPGHESAQANGIVYTVQLGALKKASEAKKLRAKFEKKGYKTFLMITGGEKHERIYKVRVGEFRKKKEAEILALKLRKTEGLKAFVTLKN
jgi:cell division septation protein DedD